MPLRMLLRGDGNEARQRRRYRCCPSADSSASADSSVAYMGTYRVMRCAERHFDPDLRADHGERDVRPFRDLPTGTGEHSPRRIFSNGQPVDIDDDGIRFIECGSDDAVPRTALGQRRYGVIEELLRALNDSGPDGCAS
ncbi:MAG: hypothetical protein QOE48_693 [Mycobacterium sp.]|jgi:hypothetical protein|nr:hypothetical protein [Mycobacterium sp.]